jgi:hypothetical protein
MNDAGTEHNDNDNDKPIKSLLKGKGLLPPVGLARLDSYSYSVNMCFNICSRLHSLERIFKM